MLFYRYILAILFFLGLLITPSALSLTVLQQTWPTLIINKDLTEEFLFNFTTQNRINLEDGDTQFYFYSPSIGYKITPKLYFWNAYWWGSYSIDQDSLFAGIEQRIWQRLDWEIMQSDKGTLTAFTRVDERKENAFNPWAYRLRERIQYNFPVKLFSIATPIVSDELFFNLNQPFWVPQTTFQQNRFYLGLSAPLNKHFIAEGGYLNQFQIFPGSPNSMAHVIYFSLTLSI